MFGNANAFAIEHQWPEFSTEQLHVMELCQHHHVAVVSKAGTGKTTLALRCAWQHFEQHAERCLLLTYNAGLKKDARQRIQDFHIGAAVEAHSFHAAALRFWGDCEGTTLGGADDAMIAQVLMKPNVVLPFGLVIVDEVQDLTPLYCEFVQKILQCCETSGVPTGRSFG